VRFAIKLLLPIAVIAVFAAGLLPPLFAKGKLDTDALNAAKAASSPGAGSALAAVQHSIAGDPGVTIVSVHFNSNGDTVQVTLAETVHTFMDGFPGLKSWFHVTSTQTSSLGA